jgi:hypothetical protein
MSRYVYPPPLDVVVSIICVVSLRGRFVGQWGDFMHDPSNNFRRIPLLRCWVNKGKKDRI